MPGGNGQRKPRSRVASALPQPESQGGTMETWASFKARSAPSSYPTTLHRALWRNASVEASSSPPDQEVHECDGDAVATVSIARTNTAHAAGQRGSTYH
jgi:hypothetical protein